MESIGFDLEKDATDIILFNRDTWRKLPEPTIYVSAQQYKAIKDEMETLIAKTKASQQKAYKFPLFNSKNK